MSPEAVDYYADGVWYDAEYIHIRNDIPYYVSVAADSPGPVLELACGTGRLAIPMAQAGAQIIGVDVVPAMIAQAEAKRSKLPPADRSRLELCVEDMRTMRLGRRFDTVILAFNTLMHMTEDPDLEAVLVTAREHLTERGLFHLDLHTPYPDTGARDPEGRYDPQEMIDPRTGDRYIVTENNRFDPRRQINTMRFYYQPVDKDGREVGPERTHELHLRVIFPRELDRWIHLAGLDVIGDWDDFERSRPFSGKGGRRVLMARARRQRKNG